MIVGTDVLTQGDDPAGRLTVLIVDDQALVRLDVATHLRSGGFRVLEAGDAYEAIQLLKSDGHIALVFSDVALRGVLDGVDLARWICQKHAGVKIILSSGIPGGTQLAALEGAIMHKPYHLRDVEATIRSLLRADAGDSSAAGIQATQ